MKIIAWAWEPNALYLYLQIPHEDKEQINYLEMAISSYFFCSLDSWE